MARMLKVRMTPELLIQLFTVGNVIGPLEVIKGIPEGFKLFDVEMEHQNIVFSFVRDTSKFETEDVDVAIKTLKEMTYETTFRPRPSLAGYIDGIFDEK